MRFLDMLSSQVRRLNRFLYQKNSADFATRIPFLLFGSRDFLDCDDLSGCAGLWKEEPSHLYLDLLHCWIRFRHVCQGLWYCGEIDYQRQ